MEEFSCSTVTKSLKEAVADPYMVTINNSNNVLICVVYNNNKQVRNSYKCPGASTPLIYRNKRDMETSKQKKWLEARTKIIYWIGLLKKKGNKTVPMYTTMTLMSLYHL